MRVLPRGFVVVLAAWCISGCERESKGRDAGSAHPLPVEAAAVPATTSVRDASLDARSEDDAGARAQAADAGAASTCRVAYGPAEMPFWGPAALSVAGAELRVVTNDSGKPRIHAVPIAAPPPATAVITPPPRPTAFEAMRSPACELAGKWAFCQGPGGLVQRTTLGATDTLPVAKGRPGTRFSAAALGEAHAVVATLDSRRTTEGETMQAFVTLDDREPVRLSEDGAGATTVHLVRRGIGVLAVYIDARAAMLPLHARAMSLQGENLALANDTVVFIGGPPERGIDFAVAPAGRAVFALLPMPRETATFGMAAVPIDDPPKTDVEAVWSMYPNGLDPAPIASATRALDGGPIWVARVRPKDAPPASPRVLELGRLSTTGTFTAVGTIAEGRSVTHVALTTDGHGAIWVVYGDRAGSYLERLICT